MVGGLSSQVENAVAVSEGNEPSESPAIGTSARTNETGWLDQLALHGQSDGGNTLTTHNGVPTGSRIVESTSGTSQASNDFGVLEVATNGDLVVGSRFWTVFCKEVYPCFLLFAFLYRRLQTLILDLCNKENLLLTFVQGGGHL
jgi:hypothetical protein